MNTNTAERNLARICLKLAGGPSDEPELESIIEDAARTKPDDFFETHGDEPEIRFIMGEDDAAAVAGRSKRKLKVLRAVALALLSMPDARKLLAVLRILKGMQGNRRGLKYNEAVNELLRVWGLDAGTLDAAGPAILGALCWRMAETHGADLDAGTLAAMENSKKVARLHAKGMTWEEIGEKMRTSGDGLKKRQHARRKKQVPRVREV